MKRYTATIRVDLVAETTEARDFLLASMVREINHPQRIVYAGRQSIVYAWRQTSGTRVGSASAQRVALSRVRQAAKRKR